MTKQDEQYDKFVELFRINTLEKSNQLYIRELFFGGGNISDRTDLLMEKMSVEKAGLTEKEKANIREIFETILMVFDYSKLLNEDDMRSVDFFKWDNLAETVKKPSKINMDDFKWTDSSGAKRVDESSPYGSWINQSFWNDAHKRIYLTSENVVEYSNYHGVKKGDKLEIADVQRLRTKGHQIVYCNEK